MSLLRELGYSAVDHYVGGLTEWSERGNPLEVAAADTPDALTRHAQLANGVRSRVDRVIMFLADSSFGTLLASWLYMVLGFGLVYWCVNWAMPGTLLDRGEPVPASALGLLWSIYFSSVTATSIGFGDVVPAGPLRVLAITEGAAGLLLFGCVVSKLVSRRQEILIEQIHQTTFEDRIGRVRTNLHVLLAEFQSISVDRTAGHLATARVMGRLESASSMFLAELRVILDLLYRPQRTPDETMLEAVLTELAADLREFSLVLEEAGPERPAQLHSNLHVIQGLSDEICSECVPNQYAHQLRKLMDEIQQLSRQLT